MYCNLALMHRLFDTFPLFVGLFSFLAVSIYILPFFIEFFLASFLLFRKGCCQRLHVAFNLD